MDFALIYLPQRALYRVGDFFHHWYWDGSRYLMNHLVSALESMDRTFAVKVTLEHFFEPLYKDYSVIGRMLGVFFRTFRVLIGALVYALFTLLMVIAYIIWLAAPIAIIAYAFLSLR